MGWGAGGHAMPWWCSSSPEAHTAATPLYERYRAELRALLGEAAHSALEAICEARAAQPLIAEHPATTAATAATAGALAAPRPSRPRAG